MTRRYRAMSPPRAMILGVGILTDLRAGAGSVVRAVTGDAPTSRTRPDLTASSSELLSPPSAPPVELGSPWVTGELAHVTADIYGSLGLLLPLTREQAMKIPAVAKARHTICPTLGRIPLDVVGTDSPETRAFITQPDKSTSRFIILSWTYDDLFFHGVSWWQRTDTYASRKVRAVRRILPGGVQRTDGGGWTVYGKPADPTTLIRIDGPHEGILNFASTTLRQAADIETAAARAAREPTPNTELHQTQGVTMPKLERKELVAEWAAARRGENGGVAYTSPNIELRSHGTHPEQLLTSGRNAAAIDIARHAGIPADAVDASVEHASMTYSTAETKMRALIDFGLAAYGAALTARLSLDDITPAGSEVVHDYDGVTATTDDNPSTPAPPPAAAPPGGGGVGPQDGRKTP